MNRKFSFALVPALLMTGMTVFGQTTNGNYTCFPLSADFFDMCTGEQISGGGQVCIADRITTDQSGGLHIKFSFRSDFTAVGAVSGKTYTEHDSSNETINISGNNSQFVHTFAQTYHVNTSGGKNNLALKELFHITINSKGEVTSFNPDELQFVCK